MMQRGACDPERTAGDGTDHRNRVSAFGMMTAFLAANPENNLEAAAAAVCAMGLAGEDWLEIYAAGRWKRNLP